MWGRRLNLVGVVMEKGSRAIRWLHPVAPLAIRAEVERHQLDRAHAQLRRVGGRQTQQRCGSQADLADVRVIVHDVNRENLWESEGKI